VDYLRRDLGSGCGNVSFLLFLNPFLNVGTEIPETPGDDETFGSSATVAEHSKALLGKAQTFSNFPDKQQVVGLVHSHSLSHCRSFYYATNIPRNARSETKSTHLIG
jgi:hypothetical protein